MRRFRNWIFLFLLGLLFIEIWLGFPIKLENTDTLPSVRDDKFSSSQEAAQKMKGVHLVESRQGTRDWELFAEAAEGFEGKGKWQIQKVKIHFYSESKVQFTVTGLKGEIDTISKDMKIEGDVITSSANGYRFQSPLLLYMAKDRILQSPGPIKMSTPPDTEGQPLLLTSDYMKAMVDKSEMVLIGHVSASKNFKSRHEVNIKSGQAFFSGAHYFAKFQDHVSIQYDKIKLESPEASFQYRSTSSLLDFIQLGGGVKLSDVEKYATAKSVRIEPESNRMILTGDPRVVQDQDEIFGEKIIFIDGGKKVKIEKMRARVEKNK